MSDEWNNRAWDGSDRDPSGASADVESSSAAPLIRHERFERIAAAERDRRAGLREIAIAAIGEPVEWPARVVVGLAMLPADSADATRQILEAGLDSWARDHGLGALDPEAEGAAAADSNAESHANSDADSNADSNADSRAESSVGLDLDPQPESYAADDEEGVAEPDLPGAIPDDGMPMAPGFDLARPFDSGELDRAFAEAEAQTDEMHGVNDVAERVLLDEPMGLAELGGEVLESQDGEPLDAAEALESDAWQSASPQPIEEGGPSRAVILATLDKWLQNLERIKAGRTQ